MKKFLSLFGLMVLLGSFSLAQSPGVKLYTDICRFQQGRTGAPVSQIYIAIPGTSIGYVKESDGQFEAKVNIYYSLEKIVDEQKMSYYSDSYNLQLGEAGRLADTTLESRRNGNLINVHSIVLEPGRYLFRAVATDSNAAVVNKDSSFYEFEVANLSSDELGFSDLKWVAGEMPIVKGEKRAIGRDRLIPQVSNSTFINEDSIIFYQELYNVDKVLQENYMIRCVVYRGDTRLFATETLGQGRSPRSRSVYKESIDISRLSSGIYYLQVELVNQKNRPVEAYREVFYVYNSREDSNTPEPYVYTNSETDIFGEYTEDELNYYLQTLLYASSPQEQNFIKSLENYDQKKNFLFNFFEKRKTPEKEVQDMWNGHLAALKYVNQEFKSGFRPGWQTDRGRVFIKYGIPHDVERHPSKANLLPYEVWRYNRLGSQTNVLFVFYDPDLATNEYPLLHSTKYGEINNPRWRMELTNGIDNDIDFERKDRTSRFNPDLEIDE